MEQIYNTLKTIKEVAMREVAGKCRLSILSRMCLVSLILMTVGVGQAWADYYTTVYVYAEPTDGGGVSATGVATSAGTYKSSDSKTQSTWLRTTVHEHQSWAKANDGYTFKGWASSRNANSGNTSNPKIDLLYAGKNDKSSPGAKTTYYAIFAGIVNNANNKPTASLDFGTIDYGSSKELTITFKHAHAGQISSSITGTNSGDFSLKSGTTLPSNSVAQGTQTITVVFKPTCSGPSSATLALSGNNGGSMSISLSGTSTPYSSTISTTDGSVNVSVGSTPTTTNLDNRVTTNADGARTYSCNNSAVTISGNSFSATKQGTYTVNVSIAQGCKYAACSSSFVITVNRLPQTLTMKNGEVFATKDKNSPTTLDLSSLKTQTGNGAVTYELVAWPNAMNGNSAKDSCVINGKNFHAWVAGTYTLRAKAAVTDQYNAVTSANFTVTVKKNVTSISGTASYNIMVDGSTAIASYSTSNTSYATPLYGNSHDFYYTISHSLPANAVTTGCAAGHASEVIGYTGSSHTITAYNAGTATLTLTQKETDVYTGASKSFNVTVYKYNSVFSGVANLNTTVENTVTSSYVLTYTKPNSAYVGAANHTAGTPTEGENSGNWYYVLGHKVTTDTQTDCPEAYKNVAITYAADTKKATGRNQGVDTVRLYQKETYKYNSGSTSFRVTVAKNGNTISYKWNNENHTAWSETMNFDEKASFTYSANNTVRPIGIEQVKGVTPGDTIATYSTDTKKVTAYYNKGQAVWSLHQDENYKYVEANATCTVTVAEMACETCYAYKSDPDNNVSKIGEIGWDIDNIANVLSFDMKPSGTAAGNDALLSYQISGNWTEANEIKAPGLGLILYKSMEPISLNPHTTRLKFEMGGDIISTAAGDVHTDDPKVNNIRVSRLTWLELNSTQTGKALDTLYIHKEIGETNKKGTFQLKVSTCDTSVKLASNDSKVTLSETSIALTQDDKYDGGYLSKNITITYTCNKKDTTDAIISVYTKYEHKSFVVRAITKANSQEIIWNSGYEGDEVVLPVNIGANISDAASASSNLLPILYRTNNSDVIRIAEDKMSFTIISSGSATLTAIQEGNEYYERVEDTKNIQATEKIIQDIIWERNFTRNLALDDTIALTAYVDTVDTQAGTRGRNEERTSLLTYSYPMNNGVIELLAGNRLHIIGTGSTEITASVQGNDRYERASYTKRVHVRQASEGCESHSVYIQSENEKIEFFLKDINKPERWHTITLSPDSGVPDKLSFSLRGVSYTEYGLKRFKGNVNVYQSSDKGASWEFIKEITAYQDSTVSSGELQLKSTTNMIKFVRPKGGEGYHYIEEIYISRAQTLAPISQTINLGNVPSGSVRMDNISFNYSELKTDLKIQKGNGDETYNKLELDEDLIEIECGSFGQYDLGFKFKPTKPGSWSQIVTITDSISTKTFTVTIQAKVTKAFQDIDWEPKTSIIASEEVLLNATATSNLPVSYELTKGSDVAKIENGKVIIIKPGEFTIVASQNGDSENYLAATPVEKNFTVSTAELTLPELTAQSITYGQPLSDSHLSHITEAVDIYGKEVSGTYSWQNNSYPEAGSHEFTVVFTPSANPLWYSFPTASATVEVAKATPTATSAEAITYGQAVKESSLSNIAAQGTWSWRDEDKETILSADEYEMDVHFTPANNNYQETDAKVLLVVNKATPELSWISAPTELGYDATDIEYLATSTSNESAITYSIISGSEFAFINSTTGVLNTIEPGNTITVQAEQDASQNYLRAITTIDVIIHAANVFTNSTGDGNWENENNWEAGVIPGEGEDVLINGDVVLSDTIMEVGNLTLGGGSITIDEGAQLTINGDSKQRDSYGDLIIKQGGEVVLGISASFKVRNFIIEAALSDNAHEAKSGQLSNGAELTVNGEAFFDLILDQSGKCTPGWYDFAVPFPVDASTGVSRFQNGAWNNELRIETHYAIMDFHEDVRAANKYAWQKYHGILNPNQCYTMTINSTAPLYRFKRKAGAPVIAASELLLQVTGGSEHSGWNALGNGNLEVRNLDVAGDVKVQLYNHATNSYDAQYANEISFATGSGFFMQAATEGFVNLLEANTTRALRAQERSPRMLSEFNLQLTANGETTVVDRLYVSASEDALDSYEIGHDLSKLGTPTEAKVAQFWCDAYGMKLCDAELPLVNNTADFNVSFFAPKAGAYTISVANAPQDGVIYLTQDGQIIWNLTVSDYEMELPQGTTSNYGLRIVAQEQVTTTLESVENEHENVRKQIINGELYIQSGNVMYDATGRRVN